MQVIWETISLSPGIESKGVTSYTERPVVHKGHVSGKESQSKENPNLGRRREKCLDFR